MRAVTAMGVAACVLGVTTAVVLGAAPIPAKASQAVQAAPQAAQKTDAKADQSQPKVEKQVVIEKTPGTPAVWVERQGGGAPNIVMRQGGGLNMPALAGDGPRLGVEIRDVAKDDVASLKLPSQAGVVIDAVTKDSAAEKAGLKPKDVLVAYDGETVRSAQQLTRLVRETAPGRAVKIAVLRDGKRLDVEAAPAEPADETVSVIINPDQMRGDVEKRMQDLRGQLNQYQFQRRVPRPGEDGLRFKMERPPDNEAFRWFGREGEPFELLLAPARGRLGVTVQELTPELATYFGVKDGVLVAGVTADSPAAKAGIKAGDVITTVNDKPVTNAEELVNQLGEKPGDVTVGLTRDRKPLTLKATIEAPKAPGRRVVLRGSPA
jgi:serine protease Do